MLVDSHCHLDAAEFDHDRDAVLARARAAGVARLLLPAIDATGWPKLQALCAADPGLFPAYGLHPVFLARHRDGHLDDLRTMLERDRPVAIGECGLDFHLDDLDRDRQQYFFDAQLHLAREFDLPVVVHARRAVDAVITAIRRVDGRRTDAGLRGVVHSFSGSPEQARQLWNAGFLLGLGGPVTYPRANRLRRLAAAMPLECLLLETDAPDQPDAGIRGQRNEPARLPVVLQTIAQLRDEDPGVIAAATTRNAERLFRLPAAGLAV